MQLRRKSVSCLAVLGVASGMVAGVAGSAQAAPLEFRIQIPKRLLVTPADPGPSCSMDVWVWGTKGSAVAYSTVSLVGPNAAWPPYRRVLPGAQVGFGVPCAPTVHHTGRYHLRVVAYDRSGKALGSRNEYWYVKFDTVIKEANASPEPVRKGRALTVKGRLGRVNDRATGYTVYPGKTMRIYFRAKGSAAWKYMGSAKTGKDGRFRKSFTARQDGTWRSYFPGTTRADRQISQDDYVDVR